MGLVTGDSADLLKFWNHHLVYIIHDVASSLAAVAYYITFSDCLLYVVYLEPLTLHYYISVTFIYNKKNKEFNSMFLKLNLCSIQLKSFYNIELGFNYFYIEPNKEPSFN